MKTPFAIVACLGLLTSGCIFVADDLDDGPMRDDAGRATDDGADGFGSDDHNGDDPGSDDLGSDDDLGGEDAGGSGTGGGSDGDTGEGLVCTADALGDPGFEAGTPSEVWTEASELFSSPLCDDSCTEDEGAGPLDGGWFAWFGGVAEAERASLTRAFAVSGEEATLTLHLQINAASGTGEDTLRVLIDDHELLAVTDADAADYGDYTEVALDVTEWADGDEHALRIEADLLGGGAVTSFFVDEVSIVACSAAEAEDETGDEPDGDGSDDGSDGGSDSSGSDGSGSDGDGSDGGGTDGSGTDGDAA